MGQFDTTIGALLLGVIFNTYLYGLVTYQYASYYCTKFNDPRWIKFTVLTIFCIDTFHSASIIYMTWIYIVENFTNTQSLTAVVWPLPFTAVVVALIAYVTQCFLSYRLFRLAKSKWLLGSLWGISTVSFALGIVCGIKAMRLDSLLEYRILNTHLTVWLCMEVAVDVFLSATLLYMLQKSRTGFRRSETVINRLTRTSIQTGLFSSTLAILSLVCFLALPKTFFYLTFGFPLSRAYTNTLMDTLLCRETLREILDQIQQIQDSKRGTFTRVSDLKTMKTLTGGVELEVRKDGGVRTSFQDDEAPSCLERFPKGKVHEYVTAGID